MFVKCDPHFDSSNCPQEKWLQLFRDSDMQKSQKETYKLVNIGFNKGYNFATWLNVFAPTIGIDATHWFEALKAIPSIGENDRCGSCDACHAPPVKANRFEKTFVEPKLHIVGVDLNKGNIDAVNMVLAALRKTQRIEDRLIVELVQAAGGSVSSGASKTLKIPKCDVGNELCKLPVGGTVPVDGYEVVPIVGVDELVRELGFIDLSAGKDVLSAGEHAAEVSIAHANQSSHSNHAHERRGELRAYSSNVLDLLHIHTEGNDPDVIKSAMELLESHRIRALIFEYHKIGLWGSTKFKDVVDSIAQHNMECFFMGQNRLWPISGKCWDPQYEIKEWSNVLCILRSDPWHQAIQPLVRASPDMIFGQYNGTVARTHGSKEIFYLENEQRHGFNSWDAFVNKGFKNEDVKTLEGCIMYDLYSQGDPIM